VVQLVKFQSLMACCPTVSEEIQCNQEFLRRNCSGEDEVWNTYFHHRSKSQLPQTTGHTEIGTVIFTANAHIHISVFMYIVL